MSDWEPNKPSPMCSCIIIALAGIYRKIRSHSMNTDQMPCGLMSREEASNIEHVTTCGSLTSKYKNYLMYLMTLLEWLLMIQRIQPKFHLIWKLAKPCLSIACSLVNEPFWNCAQCKIAEESVNVFLWECYNWLPWCHMSINSLRPSP